MNNKSDIVKQRKLIQHEYDSKITEYNLNESTYVYENQVCDAHNIVNEFYENPKTRIITLVKLPKLGANGIIMEISKLFASHSDDNFVLDYNNIYLITGMNCVRWEFEYKDFTLKYFKKNVFHNGKLKDFEKNLKTINKNLLIIIDEIDVADGKNQKLDNILYDFYNKNNIEEQNIRFIFISATPAKQLKILENQEIHKTYALCVPKNYVGIHYFLENNIIKQFYPMDNEENIDKWINEDILDNYGQTYRVHFIRGDKDNSDLIKKICNNYNIDFFEHNAIDNLHDNEDNDKNFKNIFENLVKNNHIVILIKGMFRRAEFIPVYWKRLIGAWHEKYVEKSDSGTAAQAGPGRNSWYWGNELKKGHKIGPIRSDIKSLQSYCEWYNKNTKMYDVRNNRKSFVDIDNSIKIKKNISTFETKLGLDFNGAFKEITDKIRYLKNNNNNYKNLNMRGPQINTWSKKLKDDGFYYCKITDKSEPIILDYKIAMKQNKWNFADNNYRFLICYKDINDYKTIIMILFYYSDE